MDTTVVMSVMRDAVGVTLKLGGPMLLLSMLVGVVVAVLQAVTQIHEQTISFALKLIVVVLVLLVGAMAISQPFLIPFAAVFSFSRSHSSE